MAMRWLAPLLLPLALTAPPVAAREVVNASEAQAVSVTVYRDPRRGEEAMNLGWLNGFALISETRTVTLQPGESTIRFEGVAESMVAVSALVTGLPGGTIEKNRNADLLSPAALVDGTLGNRVTVTRTNPATGARASESAIVRTRADGGLVLQTAAGFEAVRCAGIPETLSFDRVPEGLSAEPVYTVDTASAEGGTYSVQLTYLASGFDWNAHYVATFDKAGPARDRRLHLAAWLTVANGNGQGFADAELLAVAGKLEVTSDYRGLGQPPRAAPLRLTCYPLGSTARGNPVSYPYPAPPPPPPAPSAVYDVEEAIVVTGAKAESRMMDAMAPMLALEEALGDLKLYRVPVTVDVAAKAQKQVAFLTLDKVEGRIIHRADCIPGHRFDEQLARVLLRADNREKSGLGRALPAGGVTLFEPSAYGPLLIAEDTIDDYAVGQEVEIGVAGLSRVRVTCDYGVGENREDPALGDGNWHSLEARIDNDSEAEAEVEIALGPAAAWQVRKPTRKLAMQDGLQVIRVTLPAGASRALRWQVRNPDAADPVAVGS